MGVCFPFLIRNILTWTLAYYNSCRNDERDLAFLLFDAKYICRCNFRCPYQTLYEENHQIFILYDGLVNILRIMGTTNLRLSDLIIFHDQLSKNTIDILFQPPQATNLHSIQLFHISLILEIKKFCFSKKKKKWNKETLQYNFSFVRDFEVQLVQW